MVMSHFTIKPKAPGLEESMSSVSIDKISEVEGYPSLKWINFAKKIGILSSKTQSKRHTSDKESKIQSLGTGEGKKKEIVRRALKGRPHIHVDNPTPVIPKKKRNRKKNNQELQPSVVNSGQTPANPNSHRDLTPANPRVSKDQTPANLNSHRDQAPVNNNRHRDLIPANPRVSKDQTPANPNSHRDQSPVNTKSHRDKTPANPDSNMDQHRRPSDRTTNTNLNNDSNKTLTPTGSRSNNYNNTQSTRKKKRKRNRKNRTNKKDKSDNENRDNLDTPPGEGDPETLVPGTDSDDEFEEDEEYDEDDYDNEGDYDEVYKEEPGFEGNDQDNDSVNDHEAKGNSTRSSFTPADPVKEFIKPLRPQSDFTCNEVDPNAKNLLEDLKFAFELNYAALPPLWSLLRFVQKANNVFPAEYKQNPYLAEMAPPALILFKKSIIAAKGWPEIAAVEKVSTKNVCVSFYNIKQKTVTQESIVQDDVYMVISNN